MIEIPKNPETCNIENGVAEVQNQLATRKDKYGEGAVGEAYLDWGANGNMYRNCPTRQMSFEVAYMFKGKGYYVYRQTMGTGNHHIPASTTIYLRIQNKPRKYNNWPEL